MKKQLEKAKPEDFEQFGYETMQKCHDVEQAMRVCAPMLQAFELAMQSIVRRRQSEIAVIRHQGTALFGNLYDRPIPTNDALMLAHARRIKILACFTALTAMACLAGNMTTFNLWGFGVLPMFLLSLGMTAVPLGVGHSAFELIVSASRWVRMFVVLGAALLAGFGIVMVGHARRDMVDRSVTTSTVESYVDRAAADNSLPEPPDSQEVSESGIRRGFGEGIFLIVLASELALAYLVGQVIELYTDIDNTAWRELQKLGSRLSNLEAKVAVLTAAPEIAKKYCVAGILRAEKSRPRRHPPYHRALNVVLTTFVLLAVRTQAQTQTMEGIILDTSASISRGGRTQELFREYLIGTKNLLLTEPPNTRVWVLSISADSFGGTREILKGWTPDARGVFTDDLKRAQLQLSSAFEEKSSGMAPLASATDIFGALWHLKTVFETRPKPGSATSKSNAIWIFSDMMNETKDFPMPELIELGPEQMVERAKARGLLMPLNGYKVYVHGASTAGLTPQAWSAVRNFWINYFSLAGAELISYSADCDMGR